MRFGTEYRVLNNPLPLRHTECACYFCGITGNTMCDGCSRS